MHWKRWHRLGTVEIIPKHPAGQPCLGPGCGRPSVARGYCGRHIQRIYRDVPLEESGSLPERFMKNVEQQEDGCWLWTGTVAGRYGQIKVFGNAVCAHRLAFELYVGAVPSTSLVCHRCDTPLCVRPDHLFLGDASDNMRDMAMKGRHGKQVAFQKRLQLSEGIP